MNASHAHIEAPVVVKLGGRALEALAPEALAREVAPLAGRVVLVHGGGAEVSAWSARLGLEPRFVDGLRVTDETTLDVAVAVLAGLANKRLVAGLAAHGVPAAGLSALDAGIADVVPHPDAARLGAVGTVRGIAPAPLFALLAQGVTPVLASIGASQGKLLNLNADEIAGALAAAVRAPALVLLSDVPAVELDGSPLGRVTPAGLTDALAHPDVTGGMRPKLLAARAALAGGAGRVSIGAWQGPGSLAALVAGTAPATVIERDALAEVGR